MPITRTNFDLGDQEIPLDDFKEIKERSELEPIPQGVSIIRGHWSSQSTRKLKHVLIIRVGDRKLYVRIPLTDNEDMSVEYANFGFRNGVYQKVKLPQPTLLFRVRTSLHSRFVSAVSKLYYAVKYGV
jgi:hypothetical protein